MEGGRDEREDRWIITLINEYSPQRNRASADTRIQSHSQTLFSRLDCFYNKQTVMLLFFFYKHKLGQKLEKFF